MSKNRSLIKCGISAARKLLVVLIGLSFIGFQMPLHAASAKKPAVEAKQLQRLLKKLKVELKKERSKRSNEERALQKNEQSIATLASQISLIDLKLNGLNKNLNSYKANRESIQSQLDVLRNSLNLLLKQRYQMGEQTPLKLLINQKDPEQVSRMLMYFEKIRLHQTSKVLAYRELLAEHTNNNVKIDKTEAQLLKEKQLLKKQQKKLTATRALRKKSLAKIDGKISKNTSKIRKIAADKKRLDRVVSRIQKAVAKDKAAAKVKAKAAKRKKEKKLAQAKRVIDNRPFKQLKGKLPWPLKGKIGRKFGSTENSLRYDGILIYARQGTPVKAVHTGKVVFADWLRSYGMVMIVDHGVGYLTLYGHNDQLNKKVGQKVYPGEVIALAGSSGGNQRSGLYFAIRRNGQTTNPQPWFAR